MQGQHLAFRPSEVVADRIRALGRTEDVMFSPDQKRLAIAGFSGNRILVMEIRTITDSGATVVLSEGCVELLCPEFNYPHGLAWMDDDTLVVANREGDVIAVSVPSVSAAGRSVEVEPLLRLSGGSDSTIKSPGSVAVARLGDQYFDFLVCNNYRDYVSRHIVQKKNGYEVISGLRLFEHGLKVPDSIAVSTDGGLVAVSNHYGKRVDIFQNDSDSGPQAAPAVSLGVPCYPHGVRFAMQDRLVTVADAGAPLVHIYARDGRSWKTVQRPALSMTVMDEETFQRGHTNPEEGGPKGLDILADGSLLAVSCEEVPIAFFDFRPMRDQLLRSDIADQPDKRMEEARVMETFLSAMKVQHDQIERLHGDMQAIRARRLDRRIKRFLKGAVRRTVMLVR